MGVRRDRVQEHSDRVDAAPDHHEGHHEAGDHERSGEARHRTSISRARSPPRRRGVRGSDRPGTPGSGAGRTRRRRGAACRG